LPGALQNRAVCYDQLVPCEYSIDRANRLVLTKIRGEVTVEDSLAHQKRLMADPEFDPDFDQLIDSSGALSWPIAAAEARILAQRKVFSTDSCRAFVATRPALFGLARLMKSTHEASTGAKLAEVFSDKGSALEWIV